MKNPNEQLLKNYNETSFTRITGDDFASIYSSERQMMSRIRQLSAERPGEVRILVDNDDGVLAHVPANWLRLTPPKVVTLTEEQKQIRAERMRNMRRKK